MQQQASPNTDGLAMNQSAKVAYFQYEGSELALFGNAINWKRYWKEHIQAYVYGDVLEVGAGIGTNTRLFTELYCHSWTCLEPDAALAREIPTTRPHQHVVVGTMAQVAGLFDTILYIDVLEHIEDDAAELARATSCLNPGGHLVVLSPAHRFLYSPFDASIGHFRRYSRTSLTVAAADTGLSLVKIAYLDAAGMLASAANSMLLHQGMPTERQILTWDRVLIPLSRLLDRGLGYRVGKSILGIWTRKGS